MPIDWPTSPATNDTYSFGGLTWRFDGNGWRLINGPSTPGITVKDEGTTLTARSILNFTGAGVTVTDNSGTGATDITIPGGGAGTSDYIWLF